MANEKRRRHNLLSGTLGASLTNVATSVTFTAALQEYGANIATLTSAEHLALVIDSEIVYLTAYTAGATSGTIARGQEGSTAAAHANGASFGCRPTKRDFTSVSHSLRTSGSLTLNSVTWADVDNGLDLVLPAWPADQVEVGLSALLGSEAPNAYFDVATIVSGSPVNYVGGTGSGTDRGVASWDGETGRADTTGSPALATLVSGDIASGTVTLRLRYRTSSAANKTLFATSDIRLRFWAKNYGPAGT